ncbi:UDP-Glycosyltransferase/glycogen phosphorylase [Basidiobolus meristosporus CBS 931.73]|uniref:UDP-Glycosyltransferase/glycogen phosphorylase n=1 Tax=Basidiobolus meristosporus CBS 931.73 TaxID=1314790 RepID=A0A1Y1WSR5_9FUNG|nr:UDP-Glycosyltransferase/glycogen phosphorylase [Basidiobolus meristosporus CBS 931.73]|eukprot:ORX76435.1 UDP-Glycosyltransferase/glycogen phosphorylase [Basidiobolus meristosporus CBS 931.73]
MPSVSVRPLDTVTEKQSTKLRVLIMQSAHGLFVSSGGFQANLYLADGLLKSGHEVKMIALGLEEEVKVFGEYTKETLRLGPSNHFRLYRHSYNGIDTVTININDWRKLFDEEGAKRRVGWIENLDRFPELSIYEQFVIGELKAYRPTHFIFNDSVSLKISRNTSDLVKVFICHACEHLSFGPYGGLFEASKSDVETERLRKVDGIWVVSQAIQRYMLKFGNIESTHLPIHPKSFIRGNGAIPVYNNFDRKHVVAINPGSFKGFHILHEVSQRMPHVEFAAVKSWNLNDYQISLLEKEKNVTIMDTFRNMEELWSQVKILIVPSVWYEAFGMVAVEAMLRGIPVLVSNVGGLPEAKCGMKRGVIPVNLLTGERCEDPDYNEKYGPYLIPEQNADPWINAIEELYHDQAVYESHRQEGLVASRNFIQKVDTTCYERWLMQLYSKKLASTTLGSTSRITANAPCPLPAVTGTSVAKNNSVKAIKV